MFLTTSPREYIETIILAVLVVGLCFYIHPDDPFFINSHFPWIWLLPALFALQYGRIAGLITFVIVMLGMIRSLYTTLIGWDMYQSWVLGGFTLALMCAEYNALWLRRQYALDEKTNYLNVRIQSLSSAYGILRFSHDRLEESLIIAPTTLRQSFTRLRGLLSASRDTSIFKGNIAEQYMEVIASHANLERAGLYLLRQGTWDTKPVAHVGTEDTLALNDTLVKQCIREKNIHFVSVNMLELNELSQYLAVIPMEYSDGSLMGILTITDMPFLSLNAETLKSLKVLLTYIADEVWASEKSKEINAIYPDCPAMFASEIYKLKNISELAGVESSVSAYYIDSLPNVDAIVYLLIQQKRTIDIIWQTQHQGKTILFILMPLSSRNMMSGYRNRIDQLLKKNQGISLGQHPILFRYQDVSDFKTPLDLISAMMEVPV